MKHCTCNSAAIEPCQYCQDREYESCIPGVEYPEWMQEPETLDAPPGATDQGNDIFGTLR
jgi:hypothetical protein